MDRFTPFTCCSMGVATDCSTSTALAPTNVVVTWMSGGVISGYWAMGGRVSDTAPTITVTMEITIATIGRRMKKLPIAHLPVAPPGAAVDAGTEPVVAGAGAAAVPGAGGSAGAVAAFTCIPSRTLVMPSTITFSPGFTPSSRIQSLSTLGPTFTVRDSAFPSAFTTTTEY